MPAAYDTYNYPSYWKGREYEHKAEEIALKDLLEKIPKTDTVCEIGAGFGRLVPTYLSYAKHIIVSDPSARLLSVAQKIFSKESKIRFVQSTLTNLPSHIRPGSLDLAILVRVLHHIEDLEGAIDTLCRLVKRGGFLILEFANKSHAKATLKEFLRGNITFPIDIFPKAVEKMKRKTLPFLNYHPDDIKGALVRCDFKIIDKLSVSNIRSSLVKKIIPTRILLFIERLLQRPLATINFGPSIFILAKKG